MIYHLVCMRVSVCNFYKPSMMATFGVVLALVGFSLVTATNVLNNSASEVKLKVQLAAFSNHKSNIVVQKHTNNCQNRTWLVESTDGECVCANSLDGIIYCDSNTKEVYISSQFCMSYDQMRGEEVVARCPYIYTSFYELNTTNIGMFVKLPADVGELEHLLCSQLNRKGYFCSKCMEHHRFPMYPDFLKCVKCDPRHYARNWVLYIAISFGPLTVFLILVLCLRINAASAPMNSFIFVSQIISLPPFERQFYRTINSTFLPRGAKHFAHFLHSLYGLWNLNFFTTLIPPFCIPHQNAVNVIFLAYITALYPLLLLIFLYILIELHSRNVRILVWLWKPFRFGYRRFQKQWDIRSSIVDAFATFFLLSYVKLLFITFDLLSPSRIWNKNGSIIEIIFYFDATIKVHHKSTGVTVLIAGLLISFIFVYLPTILFLLYPCRFFQKFLTRCSFLRVQFLRFLMDSFLGCYKDKTNGTNNWDCRYFAFIFLGARIAISVEYTLTYFNYHLCVVIVCTFLLVMIAVFQPYKEKYSVYNRFDPIMILFLIIWLVLFGNIHMAAGSHVNFQHTVVPICCISLILPMAFIFGYWSFRITKKWYPNWISKTRRSSESCWHERPGCPYNPHQRSYGAINNILSNDAWF